MARARNDHAQKLFITQGKAFLQSPNHCTRPYAAAQQVQSTPLQVGSGLRMSRQTVRRFVRPGVQCGLHFLPTLLGPGRPCGGCCVEERPISDCVVCGHCPVRSTSQDAGQGGREGARAGSAGMLGRGRAWPVRLGPRSLTPDFLLSASVWRRVNFLGS